MPPRRSPRLHPQIDASQEGAGMARRRSTRIHPQIQPSEEGAGGARRRSSRLRPGVHSSEDTGTSPADDDMLREILLRLPPQPSSLPRASAVCKRWRGVVTDPRFHRQLYAHHRKPPLLGFFHICYKYQGTLLTSVLDPPDRIPPQGFNLANFYLLDCRHGLVLGEEDIIEKEVIVRGLITRAQRCRVAVPPELRRGVLKGAVLCAAAAADHVHGSSHSSPFKVVLVSMIYPDYQPLACVYSSEIGLWGNLISTQATCWICSKPAVLVGNSLYWLSLSDGILEFDLDENRLAVIGVPLVANQTQEDERNFQIIEADDGVIGFAELSYTRFQLWQRNVNAHGVTTWLTWKTIEMHNIPGPPQIQGEMTWRLLGYDEDTDVKYLHANDKVYGVQLRLMQSKQLYETHDYFVYYYPIPFKSFYTPGTTIAGELNGAEMLHDA